MKIIEFCGNPGVGKSTLITALTKEMRHRRIKTICYIPGTKVGLDYYLFVSKLIYKYYEIRFSKNNNYKVRYQGYCDFVSKYPYGDSLCWGVMALIFFVQLLSDKSIEYLLIDEGFIMRTTSFVYDRNFNKEELDYFTSFLNSCVYDKYDIHIAYCSVNQEQDIERIKKRSRSRDRYLFDDENEMKKKLSIKDSNTKSLINKVNSKGIIDIQTDSYNISDVCDKILLATNS